VREPSQNGITTAGREAAFNVNGLRNTGFQIGPDECREDCDALPPAGLTQLS